MLSFTSSVCIVYYKFSYWILAQFVEKINAEDFRCVTESVYLCPLRPCLTHSGTYQCSAHSRHCSLLGGLHSGRTHSLWGVHQAIIIAAII